ncbi:MAG: hypothetical protein MUF50_03775 [Planctomycetes bacterium]|nr:hypothetical protein [Planctomycetota bacterium]
MNKNNKNINIGKKDVISDSRAVVAEKQNGFIKKIDVFLYEYFRIFLLIIILAILAASYLYILKPKYEKMKESIKKEVYNREKNILEQRRELENLKKIVSDYKNLNVDDVNKLNDVIPSRYIKERLFIELSEMVEKQGFSLQSLTIKEEAGADEASAAGTRTVTNSASKAPSRSGATPINPVSPIVEESGLDSKMLRSTLNIPNELGIIKISLEMTKVNYDNLKKLLYVLENNLKLMDVTSLNYTPNKKQASLEIFTYYLK